MKTRFLLIAGFLSLLAAPVAGQNAEQLYQQLCDDGDMLGCNLLGVMYREGESAGVTQNLARAAELFEQACEGDMMESCSHLGVMYANGVGVEQDINRALELTQQACDGGHARGCSNLDALMGVMRVALLGQLPTGDRMLAAGVVGNGNLSMLDSRSPDGSYVQAWALLLRAGQEVTADLTSTDFDAYLSIVGPGLTATLNDDDSGGGCDARITFMAPEDGEYRAIVGTADPGATGAFVLRASAEPPTTITRPCSRSIDQVAVGGRQLSGNIGPSSAPTEGNSTTIVRAQLNEFEGRTALSAIQQLNSRWLRATRGGAGFGQSFARVVFDGVARSTSTGGDFEDLANIRAESVEYMIFLNSVDATIKYGTGFEGGVIEVFSRGR